MKILALLTTTLFLSVGAFELPANPQKVKPSIDPTHRTGLMDEYIDNGCYTKKTTLYLTSAAQQETSYFHGAANALQRTTYYNETEGALLMGNYDGTFSTINSGYKNVQDGGVQHFYYNGYETPLESELFSNIIEGWTNDEQRVGEYYPTLTYLKSLINGDAWAYDDTHQSFVYVPTITMTNGTDYDDEVLRAFQYFIAPMMLQGSYFSWSSIRVTKASSFLSMRLLASASDEEKSTVKGTNEVLVAEARVFSGIHLDAQITPALLRGTFDWDDGYPMEECTDIYLPEQYKYVLTTTEANTEIKLFHINSWYGKKYIEGVNQDYDENIVLASTGTYTIYFKVKGNNQRSIYIDYQV